METSEQMIDNSLKAKWEQIAHKVAQASPKNPNADIIAVRLVQPVIEFQSGMKDFVEVEFTLRDAGHIRSAIKDEFTLQEVKAHNWKGIGNSGPKGLAVLLQSQTDPRVFFVDFGRHGYLQRVNYIGEIKFFDLKGDENIKTIGTSQRRGLRGLVVPKGPPNKTKYE